MSVVSNPINAPVTAQHRLNHRAVDASIKSFAAGKVDISAVPTNLVEPTWKDAIDIVNPLQQIPVVSEIYRAVSGEKISGLARVTGGFLWGGLTGGFAAAFSAAYAENNHDQSPGEQMVAALFDTDTAPTVPNAPPPTMLAEAMPVPAPTAPATAPAAAPATTPAAIAAVPDTLPDTVSATSAQLASTSAPVIANAAHAAPGAKPATLQAGPPVFTASLPQNLTPAPANNSAGLTITEVQTTPLRDKLNRKNPSPVQPHAKPLDQYATGWTAKTGTSFLSQIPANAATLAAEQKQNLQLLQGVVDMPPQASMPQTLPTPAALAPLPAPTDAELSAQLSTVTDLEAEAPETIAAGTILAPVTTGQRNPLPLQLVQDIMMQALDKYQAMHAPAAATDGLGLQ